MTSDLTFTTMEDRKLTQLSRCREMKGKVFPVSMAVLWGIVFSQAMHSMTLGVCMGLAMGTAFGLFDSGRGENEDEERGR